MLKIKFRDPNRDAGHHRGQRRCGTDAEFAKSLGCDPELKLETIEGTGHMAFVEKADAFNRIVANF
jgi:pimeloyl-ACP methyl ester carboxylesterase